MPAVQLTTHVKSSTLYGRMVLRSYIQIFPAWWVTSILYSYGATLCEIRYYSLCIMPGKFVSCTFVCNKLVLLSHYYVIDWKHFLTLNKKSLTLPFSADGRFESNREHLNTFLVSVYVCYSLITSKIFLCLNDKSFEAQIGLTWDRILWVAIGFICLIGVCLCQSPHNLFLLNFDN